MATNIRQLRIIQGITQSKLAQRLVVSQAWMSNVELGFKKPSPAFLTKVADALGVQLEEIKMDELPHFSAVINRLRSLTEDQLQAVDAIIMLLIRRNHVR